MRVLVVEDEERAAQYLDRALSESGCVVDVARDGIQALRLAMSGQHAVILLDLMLPGIDGLDVLRALRQQHRTPVLILSARERVEDRVRGLEAGGDDYLPKPFALSELLARVTALVRRADGTVVAARQMRVADLEVDLDRRRAWRGSHRIDLTAKEFSLLMILARRPGQIFSRSQLAEQVWDMSFDSETKVVEVAIRRLRAKIDDPFERKLLHNVRGMGYLLEYRT